MSDDYLWDRSGKPDPDVEHLEQLLGRFRHKRSAPEFPEVVPESPEAKRRGFGWLFLRWPRLVFTTVAAAAVAVGAWYVARPNPHRQEKGWAVTNLDGAPRVGTQAIARSGKIAVGEALETDQSSRAQIQVSNIGEVIIEPNSRVRLLETGGKKEGLALDRGALHARINALPWQFYVDTPSATAVDLGCEYTLTVDGTGAGLLRVTLGWVQFYAGDRQALIPAGAAARTRPGVGPGTPYFEDVSPQFRSALDEIDFGNGDPAARTAALNLILSQARKKDVLSLFPLLVHVPESERARIYDRLAQLVPPPPGVTREGIVHRDSRQMNLWWELWGLEHPKK
ncbi:MAG TPA: FecR family protein [Candidatus Acidoferrales bacterium]|nr:FecR family protein [Candidatus Acidoferrales bacterium]